MPVVRFDGATLIRTSGLFGSAATQLTCAARLAFGDLDRSQWLFSPPIAAGPEGGNFKLHSSWLPFWGVGLPELGIAAGEAFSLMLAIDTTGGLSGGRTGKLWINGAEAQTQSGIGSGSADLSSLDVFGYYWNATLCPAVEVTDWVWLADAALDPAMHWASFFDADDLPRPLPPGGSVGGVTPGLHIRGNAARWMSGLDENGHAYQVTSPSGVPTGGVILDASGGDVEAEGEILAASASLVAGTASAGACVAGQTLAAGASLADGRAGAGATAGGEALATVASILAGTATGLRSPTVPGRVLTAAASLVPGRGGTSGLSRREQVLKALFAALDAAKRDGAVLLRNAVLPERVPAPGLLILRDGDPGEPAVTLSPLTYHFQHRAEVEAVVQTATGRDAAFDMLAAGIGAALSADRTLGGLCDWTEAEAPQPVDLPVEGAATLKAAVIPVVLHYATTNPLG